MPLTLTWTRLFITCLCFHTWPQILFLTCFPTKLWFRTVTLMIPLPHATPTSHWAFTKVTPFPITSIYYKDTLILLIHYFPFTLLYGKRHHENYKVDKEGKFSERLWCCVSGGVEDNLVLSNKLTMQIGHCKEIASWCFKYLPFVRAKYLIWFVWGHMCSELSQELNLTLSLNSAWILPNIGYLVSQNSPGNLCFQSWIIQNCLYTSVMFTFMRQIDKAKNKAWMPMSNVRSSWLYSNLTWTCPLVTHPWLNIWSKFQFFTT